MFGHLAQIGRDVMAQVLDRSIGSDIHLGASRLSGENERAQILR
jgi:hypothetical protein